MKETARLIIGYILGFTIFVVLVPFGLYKLSQSGFLFPGKVLICSDLARYIISSLIFIVGTCFAIWSNIFLFKIGKGGPLDALGVSISPQTKKLVTTGPYRYSRNPMVFGAFSIYFSIILYLNSIIGLICLILFIVIMIIYLKLSEEKRLLKDFGDEYVDYKKEVPMNTRSFVLSVLIAGVVIGFLANLPILNLINCALCIWVWLGGILAVFLYRRFAGGAQYAMSPTMTFTGGYEYIWSGDLAMDTGTSRPLAGRVAGEYTNMCIQILTLAANWKF